MSRQMTELEQLKADLATLERVGRIGGYANGYAVDPLIGQMRHKLEKLEAQQAPADEWEEAKETLAVWFPFLQLESPGMKRLAQYIQHLEAKVAELEHELRCERIDGGKVRDDRKAISAEQNRQKLAELTTILNAIPPACGLARGLVEKRIEGVKREMQESEARP